MLREWKCPERSLPTRVYGLPRKDTFLNVHDSEGVRYAEPQLKIMGIEAVKSSTPGPCREKIKEVLKVIVNEDDKAVNTFIQDFRKEFLSLPVEAVAFPRSVNGLKEVE